MAARLPAPSARALVLLAAIAVAAPGGASALPPGFVYADEAIPGLRTDVRYAGNDNFLGRPVAGYLAPRVILTREAADALARVQERLRPFGLGLKVFDGYRPRRAVEDFVRWARDPADEKARARHHPDVPKGRLIPEGYVSDRSAHSRGSTVDLTLAPLSGSSAEELDMGGPFDWFGPLSWPTHDGIPAQQRANRLLLRTLMQDAGFVPYPKEWWHFTLRAEPYPGTSFDFPVE
jgi:D-alanyl-D-alanine dipeptidase